jgi:hypothetical protein
VDSSGSGIGSVAGSSEQVNELTASIKGVEFLEKLSHYYFTKDNSHNWIIFLFLVSGLHVQPIVISSTRLP